MLNCKSDGLRVWHPLVALTHALKLAYAHRGIGFGVDAALATLAFSAGDWHAPWLLLVVPLAMRARALVALACTYGAFLLIMFSWAAWLPNLHIQAPYAYALFVAAFAALNALGWQNRAAIASGLGAASVLLLVLWQCPVAPPRAIGASACAWVFTSLAATARLSGR